ncbi:unnamed protein product [Arctia plantaginis]|uniref:PiggyBac transposable element-derived protein domain-containing protein n=1 Tax=Arctia plantaginis TaxID=874455 RepID=A0A8S1AWM0_ARCPL|nr:unnamed protein product [Arctia plantaginis]
MRQKAYPLQGIIYTGKTDGTREKNQGERVVKELTSPYRGSGRNVCMDNFFTTLPVAKHLLSWNVTIVVTIKKNKPYIPSVMGANKTRKQYSTVFGFHEKVTMCSYGPKKNKAVILLSTMHSDASVGDDAKQKPEIIIFYNKYKAGVDTMDQMVRRYTSQRRSSRWPMALFFNMLDISSLASYIIYYENNKMIVKKTTERRQFMRKLSEELALPMIEHRTANPQVIRHFSTKIAVESILGHALAETIEINPGPVVPKDKTGRKKLTGSCHVCNALPIKRRRKTHIISKPKRKKQNTDTESEDETDMSLRESSCSPIEEIAEGSDVENETPILTEFVKEKGFILVKFEKKKSVKHNVGQVITKYSSTEYKVSFL